jgi:hypothetical protein
MRWTSLTPPMSCACGPPSPTAIDTTAAISAAPPTISSALGTQGLNWSVPRGG